MKYPRATLVLRVPPALHRRLKQEAQSAGISLNRHCLDLLSGRIPVSAAKRASAPSMSLASGHPPQTDLLREFSDRVIDTVGSDIAGLVLFGSYARGHETAGSDIDLLVVLNGSVSLDRDVYSRWLFGKFCGREVAPLFVRIPAKGDNIGGLWFEVALDGVVLYDRELRLTRFLSRVRNLIASRQVIRRVTHGHPYWVHKSPSPQNPSEGGSL